MAANRYEDSDILIEVKNGIFYVSVKKDVLVGASVGDRLVFERLKIANGVSYPVILDVRTARYWTMDSRNSHMKGQAFDCIDFAAIIISSTALRIIWDFAVKIFPMPIKYKIFNEMEEAEAWVQEEIKLRTNGK
jgi:hypothetical protein